MRAFRSTKTRSQAGFTFAEILAALVFMAVLLPVVIQGLAIANRAAVVADRRNQATQLANNYLEELVVTRGWESLSLAGEFQDPWRDYRWTIERGVWPLGSMEQVTMNVFFIVQSREYSVRLSTLIDTSGSDLPEEESS